MSRVPGFLAIVFALLCGALPARAAQDAALERGTAITDPATLRELDGGKFRLDRMLLPERSADIPLANSELFAVPSMAPVRQAIDGEFDRYIARHGASLPKETIGVGEGFDFQLFDRTLLYSAADAVRAGRHRQPHGPHLRRGSRLRRDPPDLPPDADEQGGRRRRFAAAAADDAEPRAEGERRGHPRSPVPKSPVAGSPRRSAGHCRQRMARST